MSRIRCLRSYFCATNSLTSAFHSPGLVGGLLSRRSSIGSTRPTPSEMRPDAIDHRAGEVLVLRIGDPVRQRGARIVARLDRQLDCGRAVAATRNLPVRGCVTPTGFLFCFAIRHRRRQSVVGPIFGSLRSSLMREKKPAKW